MRYGSTIENGGVRFTVWVPNARDVRVRLLGEDGGVISEHALAACDRGTYSAHAAGVAAGADYRYVLDGGDALPDPASRWQPHGVHGASRVVDPAAFRWSDAGWRGLPSMADYVIYELHVGTFTEEGTFDAAIARLDALCAFGITAIELMPVAEFPGGRNWGYDGVHLYAAQSTYGGPDGLRRLVDAAHARGLAVVLDVVYNHLGPEGNYLDRFGPYFTDRYQTPWGRAVNYDGAGSDGVRRHVIDNALHWVLDYHVDALRLDAVHGIYDLGARHVLAELTDAVRAAVAPLGRSVHLIAESDGNDPRVVRPTAAHGLGFDVQWADDLHHAAHVALTGECAGYYADFASFDTLPRALGTPFVYDGRYSPHRDRAHGAPADAVPRDRVVVCAQNHDQIGNRATGERLSTLAPQTCRLAAALTLLSGYVPLLFMGEEYGETRPFQYFVSHGDAALVEAVREGRRREFSAFEWASEVPDPCDEATFRRSVLDWSCREASGHAELLAWYRDLIALRRREVALRPGAAAVHAAGDADARWARATFVPHPAPRGRHDARPVCVAFNCAAEARDVPLDAAPDGAHWTALLGDGALGAGHVALPAYGVAVLAASRSSP